MYEGYRTPAQLAKPDFERLRVSIEGSKPRIWREILIPENATFEDLHIALQVAFGWRDEHLHRFEAGSLIGAPALNEQGSVSGPKCLDERMTWLYDLPGSRFVYEYDFGDTWRHVIERVGKVPTDNYYGVRPHVMSGAGGTIPEDAGGIDRWNGMAGRLLKGKPNPDEALWLDDIGFGSDYDPSSFDPEVTDRRLGSVDFDIPETWIEQHKRRSSIKVSARFLRDRSDAVRETLDDRLSGLRP